LDKKEAHKLFHDGLALSDEGRHEEAIYSFERAIELYVMAANKVGEADSLLEIGNIYSNTGKDWIARLYFMKALKLYTKSKNLFGEGDALWRMGVICERHGNYKQSLDYYYKSQEKFQEAKDKKSLKKVLNHIAYLLLEIGNKYNHESNNLIKANEYYEMSLKGFQHVKDVLGMGLALTGMGIVSEREKNYDKSLEYYNRAFKRFKKAKDHEKAETVSSFITKIHKIQENPRKKY
jgi:tetratricopeptide (TPR) repeat protein